jgi:hypothetical protein
MQFAKHDSYQGLRFSDAAERPETLNAFSRVAGALPQRLKPHFNWNSFGTLESVP